MKKIFLLLTLVTLSMGTFAQDDITHQIDSLTALAKSGNVDAMLGLGRLYFMGNHAEKKHNYAEGVKWYRKAAEQGNAEAQNMLGICYLAYRSKCRLKSL